MKRKPIEIKIRLSENDATVLNRDVKKSGLSRESYLRALIRNTPIKERPPIEFVEVLHFLRGIGNNLNQIALVANSTGSLDAIAYWENVRLLQESVGQLVRGMYG